MKIRNLFKRFSAFELVLWLSSLIVICLAFFASRSDSYLTLAASLIGATALIFTAKGNVIGQILIIVFAVLYSVISFQLRYYGEMITYLGMTAMIAALSVFTWLKNPYGKAKTEVKVNRLKIGEYFFAFLLSCAVTAAFYFILRELGTLNLALSTLSVATSFLASYLTLRRSEYYALAYAANDIVLIALWVAAAMGDTDFIAMIICFAVFLINDVYGFISWTKMKTKQQSESP